MGFFKCMDSMAQDMRHPYIPSNTVLGDAEYISLARTCWLVYSLQLVALEAGALESLTSRKAGKVHETIRGGGI